MGVIVGNDATLRALANAAGVTIKPLIAAASSNEAAPAGTLYQAESWWQIQAFLFGEASASESSCLGGASNKGVVVWPRRSPEGSMVATLIVHPIGFQTGPDATNATFVSGTSDPAKKPMFSAPRVPRALTIAGSDSGGGAGIQVWTGLTELN